MAGEQGVMKRGQLKPPLQRTAYCCGIGIIPRIHPTSVPCSILFYPKYILYSSSTACHVEPAIIITIASLLYLACVLRHVDLGAEPPLQRLWRIPVALRHGGKRCAAWLSWSIPTRGLELRRVLTSKCVLRSESR